MVFLNWEGQPYLVLGRAIRETKNLSLNVLGYEMILIHFEQMARQAEPADSTFAESLLLTQREMTMEAIAERTGFSTAKYFIESFKKQKGMSPLQYRKNLETGKADAPPEDDRNSEF